MPIRINLLAEAHQLEEQRRRDPVKRALLSGGALIIGVLIWSSSLMVESLIAKGRVGQLESELSARKDQYRQILESQKHLEEIRHRLSCLHVLATNRFLVGNLLDTLQHTTVENVQLVQLKLDHTCTFTPETKAKSEGGRTLPGKPATITEKIVLALNARDTSPNAGDSINKLNRTLSAAPYFQRCLGGTNGFTLTALGTPQSDPGGRSFVTFAMEARIPEITR